MPYRPTSYWRCSFYMAQRHRSLHRRQLYRPSPVVPAHITQEVMGGILGRIGVLHRHRTAHHEPVACDIRTREAIAYGGHVGCRVDIRHMGRSRRIDDKAHPARKGFRHHNARSRRHTRPHRLAAVRFTRGAVLPAIDSVSVTS